MDRLPHMPHLHRPNKEELLAAATGFWSRLKVRFKWFSIRSVRPFNLDEITALFSWVLLGHVVWVVVGTTTFFSLLILAINTVFAQGMLSRFKSGEALSSADHCDRNTRRMGRQLSDQVIRS
jgi:distribution and morphology protein 31